MFFASGVNVQSLQSSYDPAVGLIFGVDVRRFDPDQGEFIPAYLRFTLNQSSGVIGVIVQ